MKTDSVLAWHFLTDTGKLRDGRDAPGDGEWLEHDGALELCESGLHASSSALDALRHAPGSMACRVRCEGDILGDRDKLVCRRRKIIWRVDATECLRAFARWCALQVIDQWEAPDVVRDFLVTGDPSLRDAAWDAAWAAAWAAAGAAAWDAAGDAAGAAARAAARAAAEAAAEDAAKTAQRKQLTAMLAEARRGKTKWVWE